MQRVTAALHSLNLLPRCLEQIQTAGAEATMNAMEHGNHYRVDAPLRLQVMASATAIAIKITDEGMFVTLEEPTLPDLQANLEGRQSLHGWELFHIKHLVDELCVTNTDDQHTLDLIILRDWNSLSRVARQTPPRNDGRICWRVIVCRSLAIFAEGPTKASPKR